MINSAKSRKSVLVVDDDADMRALLSACVRDSSAGAHVIESGGAIDALSKISRQRFDLLITDILMPKVDGIAMLKQIGNASALFKPKSILVVSASEEEHLPPKGLSKEYRVVKKPVEPRELRALIRAGLNGGFSSSDHRPVPADSAVGRRARVDVRIVNTVLDATSAVFARMGVHFKRERVFVRLPSRAGEFQASDPTGISVNLDLVGEDHRASLAIDFDGRLSEQTLRWSNLEDARSHPSRALLYALQLCAQIGTGACARLSDGGAAFKPTEPMATEGSRPMSSYGISVQLSSAEGGLTLSTSVGAVGDPDGKRDSTESL